MSLPMSGGSSANGFGQHRSIDSIPVCAVNYDFNEISGFDFKNINSINNYLKRAEVASLRRASAKIILTENI